MEFPSPGLLCAGKAPSEEEDMLTVWEGDPLRKHMVFPFRSKFCSFICTHCTQDEYYQGQWVKVKTRIAEIKLIGIVIDLGQFITKINTRGGNIFPSQPSTQTGTNIGLLSTC